MTVVVLSPIGSPGQQFFDNNGVPLNGGLLYTYQAGTTTPLTTYTDATGVTPNANPIVLDSTGRITGGMWLASGVSYKLVLKTSAFVQLGSWDNVELLFGATATQIAAISSNTNAIALLSATKSGFSVYRSASLTVSSGAQIIKFDSVKFDNLSEYSISTGIWTPTITGKYIINAGVGLSTSQSDGTIIELILNNNGSIIRFLQVVSQGAAGALNNSGSAIISASAGDSYTISVSGQSGGSAISLGLQNTWFGALYIGP